MYSSRTVYIDVGLPHALATHPKLLHIKVYNMCMLQLQSECYEVAKPSSHVFNASGSIGCVIIQPRTIIELAQPHTPHIFHLHAFSGSNEINLTVQVLPHPVLPYVYHTARWQSRHGMNSCAEKKCRCAGHDAQAAGPRSWPRRPAE